MKCLLTLLVWARRWGEHCFVYFGKPFMNVRVPNFNHFFLHVSKKNLVLPPHFWSENFFRHNVHSLFCKLLIVLFHYKSSQDIGLNDNILQLWSQVIFHILSVIPKGDKINPDTWLITYVCFINHELYHEVHTVILLNYIWKYTN